MPSKGVVRMPIFLAIDNLIRNRAIAWNGREDARFRRHVLSSIIKILSDSLTII